MAERIESDLLEHDAKLAEIVRRLADAYHPVAIYLFGSKARGDAGPDSDYDLLMVVSDDAPPERRRSRLAYETLWRFRTSGWHDVPFRKTHDLKELGDACIRIEATLTEAIARAVPLTEYAWKFRVAGAIAGAARRADES